MKPAPPPNGVRPGIWVMAALFVSGVAFVLFQVSRFDAVESSRAAAAERAREPSGARADRRSSRSAASAGGGGASAGGGGYQRHDWGRESELSRRIALGLPQPGFWRAPPASSEEDPQLAAMWRSFHWQREADAEAPPLPFEPTAHRAELVHAEGDVAASPTSCDVRVLPVEASGFNCVVRVMCDGAVLYPNPSQNAGYVPCELEDGRPVRAVDDGQTDRDGDPLVDLDLVGGTVTVEDYAPDGSRRYRATLRIDNS